MKIIRFPALSLIHRSVIVTSLFATSVWAAEFQNGQAARAVIGQSSFSAREAAITPTVLAISNGWLYAAAASHRLLTFDLSQIPGPKDEPAEHSALSCALCGFSVVAISNQAVLPGVAGVSIYGRTIVAADTQSHRVLIWRDSSLPRAAKGPDVLLGRTTSDFSVVSASTIVDPVSVAFDGKRLFVGDAALHRILIWNSLPATDTQPADVVLGQQSFSSVTAADVPAPDTINRPTSIVSDGTNVFVADALDHRVLVFTAADLPLSAGSILNSASLAAGPSAPGTLVTVAGIGVALSGELASEGAAPLPTKLAGVEVFLNGMKLSLLSTAGSEIRAQLPYQLDAPSAASLYVRIERDDGTVNVTNAVAVKVLAAAPGLFAFGGPEPRSGMILHAAANSAEPGTPVTSENPARPGEVLVVWTAGLGAVDDSDAPEPVVAGQPFPGPGAAVLHPVSATVSGRLAPVVEAQLPEGSIGIYQLRVTLPPDLPDDARTPLVISQEGIFSNIVTIPVRKPID